MGCQERGGPPPPARHVVGVAAMVSSLASLHPEAGRSPEKPVMVVVVEDLVSSPESTFHQEAGQDSEKGKYLGRISQDHASALPQHYAPSLCRALRDDSSSSMVVVVRVLWGALGVN